MSTPKPSSRRFLAPNALYTQKPEAKPSTGSRNGFVSHTQKLGLSTNQRQVADARRVTPAKRFNVAPVKYAGAAEGLHARNENVDGVGMATQTARPKLPWKMKKIERIEEGPHESQDAFGTEEDGHSFDRMDSVEHSSAVGRDERRGEDHTEDEGEEEEILFQSVESSKRRRISPEPSSSASIPDPHTPAPGHRTAHNFHMPAQKTPAPFPFPSTVQTATPGSAAPHSHHRPHFILPAQPTSPPKPSKPLPEIFSPSRKNQRYVPGGLASTMQSWIIEMASTGFAAQDNHTTGWGRPKEDGVKLKARITNVHGGARDRVEVGGVGEVDCFSGAVLFARGTTDPGLYNASRMPSSFAGRRDAEVRILLAGKGGAKGEGGFRIREGSVVGVRAPMWDVEIQGEKWVVGVDWVVF